jgi:hypothetical protein
VPALIPIAYEPGYRTGKVGRFDDGLFLASAWDQHVYVHFFRTRWQVPTLDDPAGQGPGRGE